LFRYGRPGAERRARDPAADQRRGTLAGVTLALLCMEISLLALVLAVPDMARLFRRSPEVTQDALSAYLLSLGAALAVAGRVADILGRRRVFVAGCLLFALTLAGSALSPSLPALVVFRVVQGAGAGLMLPAGIALVRAGYSRADRQARALGLCFALVATGSVAGPLLGGWLAEGPGWPWIFWLLMPVAAAAIALTVRFTPESRTRAPPPSFDVAGAAMVVLGVAAIGSGIERADSVGWSDVNIALLAAGLVVLAAFPLRSGRAAYPLIDLSVFSNPRFVVLLFLSSVGAACYAATLFAVSVYLQDARGLTAVRASLAFAVMAVLQALAAPVGARLQPRTRPLLVLAGAGLISGASLVALTVLTSWWAFVPVLALCGFGLGLEYAVATMASQQVVGPDRAGEVSGIVLTIRTTAAGISLAAAASIIEAVEHAGHGTGAACQVTLLIVGFLSLAGALIATSARYVFVRHGLT
jgi:MFS family permease